MGLDVCLYKYMGFNTIEQDYRELEKHNEVFEDIYTKTRQELVGAVSYSELEPEQINNIKNKVRVRLSQHIEKNNFPFSVGEYGDVNINSQQIEMDSKLYPEHMFKIGYMRSSYNASGFNSYIREIIGHDLYWVFDVKDEYIIKPDWEKAKIRIGVLIDQLGMDPGYSVLRVSLDNLFLNDSLSLKENKATAERDTLNRFMKIIENNTNKNDFNEDGFQIWPSEKTLLAVLKEGFVSPVILIRGEDGKYSVLNKKDKSYEKEAIKIYEKEMEKCTFENFSSIKGNFFKDGVNVRGMYETHGRFGEKCFDFIMFDSENTKWYMEAALIVQEMIEYVLNQDEPKRYYFHWSG